MFYRRKSFAKEVTVFKEKCKICLKEKLNVTADVQASFMRISVTLPTRFAAVLIHIVCTARIQDLLNLYYL